MMEHPAPKIDVSVILPVYNAKDWLDECLESILQQTGVSLLKVELSVFNDSSTDSSKQIFHMWTEKLTERGVKVTFGERIEECPLGVGYAKNRAVEQSCGEHLCFMDADDVMMKERILMQYQAAQEHPDVLIGSQFRRIPEDSTIRYTRWANSITQSQLHTQIYTSHGPTLIMPTWFCSRKVFNRIGSFCESGHGTPEDLIFFYQHLNGGGKLYRVDEVLLKYRYHPSAATFSVHESTIWNIRMKQLEEKVLKNWSEFTIWNAGKQGRQFYRSLSEESRKKAVAFCDVDANKIRKGVYIFEEASEIPKPRIPILHFNNAKPPFIICVKLDLTGGNFERNLASLNLTEGIDYFHFS